MADAPGAPAPRAGQKRQRKITGFCPPAKRTPASEPTDTPKTAAADDDHESDAPPKKMPNMVHRSRAEVFVSAYLLSALGALSEQAVIDSMNAGDERGLVDLAFVGIPGVPEMLVEFDPFNPLHDIHGMSAIESDEKKTD